MRVVRWLVTWTALWGLWVLLAGNATGPELVVGAGAAALAAFAGVLGRGSTPYPFHPRWWLRVPRCLAQAAWDSLLVLGAILRALFGRRVEGRFLTVPLPPEPADGREAARTAAHVMGSSFAPNTYAARVRRDEGEAVIHQLVPRPPPSWEPLP